ncbi:hypothetical protein [Magnetospirillum moscoviense]|uniref:Uncharacterized protein n=1 Tax=Magnetospirillum moscoviense TaxID=1437059 RepID=A0A178M687_9PROT|nr:hypothetical protein [Magnetospirillum moscoviense]OAN44269.1 hypothetical protein A6A05_17665 [Magnetospirillum moscoviense]
MLRIEEIVGAMDDDFRDALEALTDERLAELAGNKRALDQYRPVGVSHTEAMAMIAYIQEIRANPPPEPVPEPTQEPTPEPTPTPTTAPTPEPLPEPTPPPQKPEPVPTATPAPSPVPSSCPGLTRASVEPRVKPEGDDIIPAAEPEADATKQSLLPLGAAALAAGLAAALAAIFALR